MVQISSVPSDKKTQGRRKIEIKPLKDKSSRQQVTFSKRRSGLFKKAGELAILCESALAIIVFSPGRKAFFFGHPNPNTVIDHFLSDSSGTNTMDATLPDNLHELNKQYAEAVRELEAEKRRGKELVEENRAGSGGEFWWERPVADGVGMEELEFYMAALQELKSNAEKKLDDMVTVRHIHREVPDALEAAGTSRSHAGVLNRFARQAGAGPAGDDGGGLGFPADLLKGGLGHFVYGQGHV